MTRDHIDPAETAELSVQHVAVSKLTGVEVPADDLLTPTTAEYAQLRASIGQDGIVEPLQARRSDHHVFDGRIRLRIAREIGLETVPVVLHDLDEKVDLAPWVLRAALHKRHLSDWQKFRLACQLHRTESDAALRRMKAGRTAIDKGRTRDKLAEVAGLKSGRQFARALQVLNAGDPKLLKALDQRKISIGRALRSLKEQRDSGRAAANATVGTISTPGEGPDVLPLPRKAGESSGVAERDGLRASAESSDREAAGRSTPANGSSGADAESTIGDAVDCAKRLREALERLKRSKATGLATQLLKAKELVVCSLKSIEEILADTSATDRAAA